MANEDSIPFGVDPNGKIVFVQDVPRSMRGLKCECTCAICREPLVARLGKIRERHFAHKAGSVTIEHNSRSARESVLHKAAKQMLEKKTQFLLPEIAVPVYGLAQEIEDSRVRDSMPDRLVFAKQRRISIDCLQFEKRIANIIPDAIVGKYGNGAILIEFAVTHFADSRKIEAIKKLGMPVVEVDLRHIDMMSLSREALEFEILSNPNNRYWLTLDDTVREWAAREFRRIEALKTSYYQRLDREVAERKRAEEELKRRKTEELAKKQEEKRRQEEKEEKKRAEEWRKEVREEALRKKEEQAKAKEMARVEREQRIIAFVEALKGDKIASAGPYSRWLMCVSCGCIDKDDEFVAYGGTGMVNKGICRCCYKYDPTIVQLLWTPKPMKEGE